MTSSRVWRDCVLASGMRTLKDSVGVLKVKVVEAADLLASDPNGKSDPFCVVKLGDMQELKTDVIPTTLNPKWNCTVCTPPPPTVLHSHTTLSHSQDLIPIPICPIHRVSFPYQFVYYIACIPIIQAPETTYLLYK